ncbi:extracellular solute-binding protein [Microbacterium gorillae]|uniref:extracellular solute-binding protein n=1 Tax=Microbacterium gorillae TaxID=1231063 RepID=UPI00058DE7BC|nr:extracellular solute-binding protein [Microbacterium gorillae]
MFTRSKPIIAAGATAAALLLLTSCSGSPAAGDASSPDFVYFAAGGYTGEFEKVIERTLFAAYGEATGGQVQVQKGDCGISNLAQQVQANNVTASLWVFCSTAELDIAAEEGLLQPIDTDVVPVDLIQEDHHTEYGVDFGAWTMGLAYDADAVKTAPTSIGDFFDTETFPGKRCVSNFPVGSSIFEAALLHDGVAPEDIYPMDLDRAYAAFDRIKSDILFFSGTAEGNQNLLTGQCSLLITSAGDTKITADQNPDRDIRFVQEDGVNAFAAMGIPKGAPNPTAANEYMKVVIEDRDAQSEMLANTVVVPVLLTEPLETPAGLEEWSGLLSGKGFFTSDERWYFENFDTILQRWNDWLVS